jgi:hypothetical protein
VTATPQNVSFAGLPVIGCDVVVPRGTRPGVARLRLVHDQPLNLSAGTLALQAGNTVSFAGMVPDLKTIVWQHRPHEKREYRITLHDRRAGWPGVTVSGNHNVRRRDNSIEPGTEKTAAELADLALAAVGESGGSVAPEAKPTLDWQATPVDKALDSISAVLPVHVCRTIGDAFEMRTTGSGATLPDNSSRIIPDWLVRADRGPKTVKARLSPTWFQCGLELEAVGLEASGEYEVRDSLSYTPSGGWEPEWPTLFSGVDPFSRGFAFRSVYRVYRIKVPQELPFGFTLYDLKDIDLDPHCVVFGQSRQPEAVVLGNYWPYSDHYKNTENCPFHSAGFELDRELRAVRFDYPVWKAGSYGCVEEADLKLYTGFHLRDPDTGDWRREEIEVEREQGEGEQIVELPFLWRAWSFYAGANCATGTENDNKSSLTTETNVYLNAWKAHWDAVRDKRFAPYAGVEQIALSGNVAEVCYRLGRGLTPITEASQHYRNSMVRV